MPIPAAVPSKDSIAGIAGSNPAEGMDVCLLSVSRAAR
jgi:hypothetical protein